MTLNYISKSSVKMLTNHKQFRLAEIVKASEIRLKRN